jgi:hypothetical protein
VGSVSLDGAPTPKRMNRSPITPAMALTTPAIMLTLRCLAGSLDIVRHPLRRQLAMTQSYCRFDHATRNSHGHNSLETFLGGPAERMSIRDAEFLSMIRSQATAKIAHPAAHHTRREFSHRSELSRIQHRISAKPTAVLHPSQTAIDHDWRMTSHLPNPRLHTNCIKLIQT